MTTLLSVTYFMLFVPARWDSWGRHRGAIHTNLVSRFAKMTQKIALTKNYPLKLSRYQLIDSQCVTRSFLRVNLVPFSLGPLYRLGIFTISLANGNHCKLPDLAVRYGPGHISSRYRLQMVRNSRVCLIGMRLTRFIIPSCNIRHSIHRVSLM